jgi:hypothetical protein
MSLRLQDYFALRGAPVRLKNECTGSIKKALVGDK